MVTVVGRRAYDAHDGLYARETHVEALVRLCRALNDDRARHIRTTDTVSPPDAADPRCLEELVRAERERS
jgi:hypothetical protein